MAVAEHTTMSGPDIVALSKQHSLFEWSAQGAIDPIPVRDRLWIVAPELAPIRVPELARAWAPVRVLDFEPERALA